MERQVFACLKLEREETTIYFATPTDWIRNASNANGEQIETRSPRPVVNEGIAEILGSQGSPVLLIGNLDELAAWSVAPQGSWGIVDRSWAEVNLKNWFGPGFQLFCRNWETGPFGFIEEELKDLAHRFAHHSLDLIESEQGDFEDRIYGQLLQRDMALVAREIPVAS